jgi:hypothetical protein
MEERLRYILTLTNDWLKFAETKNAALLVFCGALGLGVLQRLTSQAALHVRCVAVVGLGLLAAAAFCALVSFIPKLDPEHLPAPGKPDDNDNLLFYGHTAKYSPQQYLDRLTALCPPPVTAPGIPEQHAQQIITNARIALKKYAWFTRGVRLGVIAVSTFIVAGVLQLVAM